MQFYIFTYNIFDYSRGCFRKDILVRAKFAASTIKESASFTPYNVK